MITIEYSDLEVLIERVRLISGFDFSGYARPSLLRQASRYLSRHSIDFCELLTRIEQGGKHVYDLIQDLTVNYSEMFRDPDFFGKLKSEVLAYMESSPAVRVWIAGCASGEEAFSMAILLKEAGYYDRSRIYATDLNNKVLSSAKEGVFTLGNVRSYSQNYLQADGRGSLSDYYHVAYNKAIVSPELRKNIVFALHDLTCDGIFHEFQLVSCRNVLIYFTLEQRKKVLGLLYNSLAILGFLCLGKRESLRYSGFEEKFKVIDGNLNIYQKIR